MLTNIKAHGGAHWQTWVDERNFSEMIEARELEGELDAPGEYVKTAYSGCHRTRSRIGKGVRIMKPEIGQTATIEKTLDKQTVEAFASVLRGTTNPIHLDEDFAKNHAI